MQPLHTISGAGAPLAQVLVNLALTCNYALKDRPFRYLDTVVVPEMSRIQGMTMPQLIYNVSMIFEAESQEAIDEFYQWAANDSKLKELCGMPTLQVVK